MVLPHGRRCPVAVPLDQPVFVVGLPEVEQGEAELLDGLEGPHPEEVLLERPDEPLGAAVALGRADEGRRALGAEEGDLLLEGVGHVLAAVVVADGETAGGVLGEPAEAARTPWRIGSSASWRVPRRAAWMPTHSAEQWSTATNTAT